MITILAPTSGWTTPLEAVPDEVFANQMLGGGIAIDPTEGILRSPGDGRIISRHAARHAVIVELDCGPIVLLHIGIDTVALNGQFFEVRCHDGDRVAAGQELIHFDIGSIARHAPSLVIAMIVTNQENFQIVRTADEGPTVHGAELLWLDSVAAVRDAAQDVAPDELIERRIYVPLAHGLHARPAARLAQLANEFQAKIDLVAHSGRTASARSAVGMLSLALAHGSEVTLRATGSDAGEAVEQIAALIESGMGEHRAVASDTSVVQHLAETADLPRQLFGITAVDGIAIGPAYPVVAKCVVAPRDAADPSIETSALTDAIAQVRTSLGQSAAASGPLAAIAQAHLALLDDPELLTFALGQIGEGRSAGHAWAAAIEHFAEPLRAAADHRFAARIDDLDDLRRRVVYVLMGETSEAALPPAGAILVGRDILPSQLMACAEAGLAGLAVGSGSSSSHVAIIAAGLGIPTLCGLGLSVGAILKDSKLLIRDGCLIIDPEESELKQAVESAAAREALKSRAKARKHESAITRDGTRIEIFANLGSSDDARRAVDEGAEGCGLLRTEFLFLDRSAPPSRDEQRQAYQEIADTLDGRPLIVRTLDIGADKPVPWLSQPQEDNPALGQRGIRLQLAHADLLEAQLGALIDTYSKGGIRIMLPMVTELAEIAETRAALTRIANDAGQEVPELGIMIETPAAAMLAATLAAEADFFSIGSNDLSQYTLARDRTAASVAVGLDALHPAILQLMHATVLGASAHGRWVGLCGGLASDPLAVPVLVGLGITELSAAPASVAVVKHLVRGLDLGQCRQLALAACEAPDAKTVRELSQAMMAEIS